MLTTFASYKLITRDLDLSLQQKSEEGPVALETANYMEKIGQIKTIDEFINDHRLFNCCFVVRRRDTESGAAAAEMFGWSHDSLKYRLALLLPTPAVLGVFVWSTMGPIVKTDHN